MSLIKFYRMLQNASFTAFAVFEWLSENQQGVVKLTTHSTQIRAKALFQQKHARSCFLITHIVLWHRSPAGNYMFNVNNGNFRTRCEICSSVCIGNFERVNSGWEYTNFFPMLYALKMFRAISILHFYLIWTSEMLYMFL